MTINNRILTALLTTQVVFSLACISGGAVSGNVAGAPVDIVDDEPPPRGFEEPDEVANDGRCEWLGPALVSQHDATVLVTRFTDLHRDCDGTNEPEHRWLFRVDADGTSKPLVDLDDVEQLDVLEAGANIVLLGQDVNHGDAAWKIDRDGTLLASAALDVLTANHAASPSGRWIASTNAEPTATVSSLFLLDTETMTQQVFLQVGSNVDTYRWLDGDQLVTLDVSEGPMRLAFWDFSGDQIPMAPTSFVVLDEEVPAPMYVARNTIAVNGDRFAFLTESGVHVYDRAEARFLDIQGDGLYGPVSFAGPEHVVATDVTHIVSIDLSTGEPTLSTEAIVYFAASARHPGALYQPYDQSELSWFDATTGDHTAVGWFGDISTHTQSQNAFLLPHEDGVLRVDATDGTAEMFEIGATRRVVWMPAIDRVLTDMGATPVLHLLDPDGGDFEGSFDLSGSYEAPTPLEWP